MTPTLYVGLDAGGTKTALLGRSDDREVRESAAGVHLLRDGVAAATDALVTLVESSRGNADLRGVCVGIAGAGREDDRASLETSLEARLGNVLVRVVHDAEIALRAAWGHESGVVLIVGTGSVLFARDEEGAVTRAGGWGWRVGDDGSGTALGRSALRIALAAHDGGPPSTLTELLSEDGLDTAEALRHAVYVESRPLSLFAPSLVQAAEAGDWQAEQALMRETNALGQQAGWLATRLGESVQPRLALVGGLASSEAYRSRLISALERHLPGWGVSRSEREPVEGALELAEALQAA